MIFSKDKWNGGKEISAYVPTSSSLSFQKMESSLSSAQQMFLLPLVESKLMQKIEDTYASQDTASDDALHLLTLAQRAVANLAFWHDFDALIDIRTAFVTFAERFFGFFAVKLYPYGRNKLYIAVVSRIERGLVQVTGFHAVFAYDELFQCGGSDIVRACAYRGFYLRDDYCHKSSFSL